jgi:hypothetical protein
MKHFDPTDELQIIAIKMVNKTQRELMVIKILLIFTLLIVSFDYLADMGWLGGKSGFGRW